MQKYQEPFLITSSTGLKPVAGANVRVYLRGTTTLATIYKGNGTEPITQPLVTDSKGMFPFYAANGEYTLAISGAGFTPLTQDIELFDADDLAINDLLPPLMAELAKPDASTKIGYGSRTVSDKLREVVSIEDFGAEAGESCRAQIQSALDSGAVLVNAGPGQFIIDGELVVRAGQEFALSRGTVILLENSTPSVRAIKLDAGAVLSSGRVTSTIRHDFLVNAFGADSRIEGTKVYFATPPGLYPMDEAQITYNKGGIELRGARAKALGCETYNLQGIGIVSYAEDQEIDNCRTHHNGFGIHVDHNVEGIVTVTKNVMEYNDSLGILANHDGVQLAFFGNTTRYNGSHGAYLRASRSVLAVNFAYKNYRDGIKIRDCVKTVLAANAAWQNNVEGGTSAEFRLQINEFGSNGVTVIGNVAASTVDGTGSFNVSHAGTSKQAENLVVIGNAFDYLNLAHSDRLACVGNAVSKRLQVGVANAAAPAVQPNALISANYVGELLCTNRIQTAWIMGNVADQLTAPTTGGNLNNHIKGNLLRAQAVPLERRFFKELSGNRVIVTAAVTGEVFRSANNAADNSYKIITYNFVTGNTTSLISDSVNTVSGDKNIIAGNMSDLSTSASMFSLWGNGHSVVGNTCIGTSGTGFVGMNNSWLIGNSPKVSERAGTTGNQNI